MPLSTPALLTAAVSLLPDLLFSSGGPATEAFIAHGVRDLRAAARRRREIPYGRISRHRERLAVWLGEHCPGLALGDALRIREACIAAISDPR